MNGERGEEGKMTIPWVNAGKQLRSPKFHLRWRMWKVLQGGWLDRSRFHEIGDVSSCVTFADYIKRAGFEAREHFDKVGEEGKL